MYAVVNKLTLGKPLDDALLHLVEQELAPLMRQQAGFLDTYIVSISDTEAVLVVLFETRESMDDISRNVAAPWFAKHFRPYLGGPAQRSTGEVVFWANAAGHNGGG